MGCGPFGAMFARRSSADRVRLERKLCVARETPEPVFDLSDCNAERVPHGVYSLCRVFRKTTLRLDANRLTSLEGGGDLADLRLLTVLSLTDNHLRTLPHHLRHLVNLIELRLDRNRLEALPDEALSHLHRLQILTAADNRLARLPASVGDLGCLRHLDVRDNPTLVRLPVDLHKAKNLTQLLLDADRFGYPPPEVTSSGTESIMKFLCAEAGVQYESPDVSDAVVDGHTPSNDAPSASDARSDALMAQLVEWEQRERQLGEDLRVETQLRRDRLVAEYALEQERVQADIDKIQHERDADRDRLLTRIRGEELHAGEAVRRLLDIGRSDPLRVQQNLEHDRRERDDLLEMCRTNYADLKRADTLAAMESLLLEECEREKSLKLYSDSQSEARRSVLLRELHADDQLGGLLKSRGESQRALVEELLRDESMQKAAVGALLERCDARSWGLVQEISLVESQLAKLSAIEMDRRKLELDENVDTLSVQRSQLSVLLIDLLDQREVRRSQLIDTLRAMESEKTSSDFWLIRYQQLLESAHRQVVAAQRILDPLFVNHLLQQGVIHCLPFLIKKISSREVLANLDNSALEGLGVKLTADRQGVLKAVSLYLEETQASFKKLGEEVDIQPSAPPRSDSMDPTPSSPAAVEAPTVDAETEFNSECVVCMEVSRSIIFIPCGHLCCCAKCSEDIGQLCPMCRQNIERKIHIIQS